MNPKTKRKPATNKIASGSPVAHQRMFLAKRAVKQKYPEAYAIRYAGPSPWVIYSGDKTNRGGCYNHALNVSDKSQRAAWEAFCSNPLAYEHEKTTGD